MKQAIIILGIIFLIAFTPSQQNKKFKFEFTEVQLNAVWNCIENSNAPHQQVKEVQALIQSQLQSQIPKTPITDTTKLKK